MKNWRNLPVAVFFLDGTSYVLKNPEALQLDEEKAGLVWIDKSNRVAVITNLLPNIAVIWGEVRIKVDDACGAFRIVQPKEGDIRMFTLIGKTK